MFWASFFKSYRCPFLSHAKRQLSPAPGATPTGDLREHEVEGTTFNPDAGRVVGFKGMDANLEAIAAVCSLCTEAHLECTVSVSRTSDELVGFGGRSLGT